MTLTRDRFELVVLNEQKNHSHFPEDVLAGLSSVPKSLPFVYFYDEIGSRLFEEISRLPEYYLTRAEAEILDEYADEMIGQTPPGAALIELGSGSSTKTRILMERLLRRDGNLHYVPIDISDSMLSETSQALVGEYAELQVTAFAAEYEDGLRRASRQVPGHRLVLFLGSSIGNLSRSRQVRFLRRLRRDLGKNDRLLLGADLQKDREMLEAAYNDSEGVTADFNLNLLERINRELDGNFDLANFQHLAFYNPAYTRVEMHLRSRRRQEVDLGGLGYRFGFRAQETIHTENSYKFSLSQIEDLCRESGFRLLRRWLDRNAFFSLNLLEPTGERILNIRASHLK